MDWNFAQFTARLKKETLSYLLIKLNCLLGPQRLNQKAMAINAQTYFLQYPVNEVDWCLILKIPSYKRQNRD